MKPFYCALLALAACSGGSSTDTADNSGKITPPAANNNIGTVFARSGNAYTATVNGKIFSAEPVYLYKNHPILPPSVNGIERKSYIAIDGAYVEGFGASYSSTTGIPANFSFYGLAGTPTSAALTGNVTFTGVYMQADASHPNAALFAYEAVLNVNYTSGAITGQTINVIFPNEASSFTGNMAGNNVQLTISDQFGSHHAIGAVYGPNGEEIAVGYTHGVITGLVYGQR